MKKEKLKVAWFSDLALGDNPQSLSAYFSHKLLPYLQNKFDITLYHNSFKRHPGFKTFHYLKAFEDDLQFPYDIFFYNLEDDKRSNFVRSHIGLIPGITYFHHFNFSNYGPEPLLNSPYQDVVKKFNQELDDWPKREKKYKPSGPAAFREAALSPVAIFSSAHLLNQYKQSIRLKLQIDSREELNAFYLPYPIEFETKKLKNSSPLFKVAMVGSVRIENRPHKVLAALKDLNFPYKLHWLLRPDELNQAAQMLQEFSIENAELHDTYNPDFWQKIVSDADCALHTLFSVYSHLEPFLGISLYAGAPVIATNFAAVEYLPDKLVFKIDPGERESLQIKEALKFIAANAEKFSPDLSTEFAAEFYNAEQVALELAEVFRQRSDYLAAVRAKWKILEKEAAKSLLSETLSFLGADSKFLHPVYEELGWKR